jgi:hypothetical protein
MIRTELDKTIQSYHDSYHYVIMIKYVSQQGSWRTAHLLRGRMGGRLEVGQRLWRGRAIGKQKGA